MFNYLANETHTVKWEEKNGKDNKKIKSIS